MRKPVFRGLASQSAKDEKGDVGFFDDSIKRLKRHLQGLWETPGKASHMKSATAVPVLVSYRHDSSFVETGKPFPLHKRLHFYKIFIAGLTDIVFRESFLLRLDTFNFWHSFWDEEISSFFTAISADGDLSVDKVTQLMNAFVLNSVDELQERRLKVEKSSPVIWNILMALAALLNVSMNYGSVVPLDMSDKLLHFLMDDFFESPICESEEAKGAVFFSLAYISRSLIPTDEAA
ncbi:hypothetical protein BC829DRAFT_108377 [Chytridium lagenaria]|nr:hypothetical protein BC829DRAFT_108377 [Chytridium lagenaria]